MAEGLAGSILGVRFEPTMKLPRQIKTLNRKCNYFGLGGGVVAKCCAGWNDIWWELAAVEGCLSRRLVLLGHNIVD